jgi:hypothetical protein
MLVVKLHGGVKRNTIGYGKRRLHKQVKLSVQKVDKVFTLQSSSLYEVLGIGSE